MNSFDTDQPEDLSLPLEHHHESSPGGKSHTSSSHSSTGTNSSDLDSLAGLPPHEVERIALEFLSQPPSHPFDRTQQLVQIGGNLDPFELPRTTTTNPEELQEREKKAIEYLKECVNDLDKDDWKFTTPRVFGPPTNLTLRRTTTGETSGGGMGGVERGKEDEEGVGWDNRDGNGSGWIDRAFNLDRYQVEGLSGTFDDLDLAATTTTSTIPTGMNAVEEEEEELGLVDDFQGQSGFGDSVGEEGYGFHG